ncbi:MAG: helix-turn-helix domain-containing protein [Mixta calida]|nr:helix-turn-helix domain-containing protein [Mixta calida]
MTCGALSTIKSNELSNEDRKELVAAIQRMPEGSAMSILLQRMLTTLEQGTEINVFSNESELSPNQAAKLLKMSRPHLLTFMDKDYLPFHRVGNNRRIKMSDLVTFMDQLNKGAEFTANALHQPFPSPARTAPLSDAANEQLESLGDL